MIRRLRFLLFLPLCTVLLWASKTQFDPLPEPVSNNAVALLKAGRSELLFSLMGIGVKKSWDSITNSGYALDTSSGDWTPLNPVPGTGRIAAVAVGVRDRVFLFGGYVVDAQGNETTVPDVNVMELKSGRWFRGADIPVPVDDAVAGVYRERYIYLIGGWSKNDSVRNVQVYNIESDKWQQATPIPGTPVFGHAGGLVGDTMVYVDGASRNPAGDKPKYIPVDECWSGRIDRDNPLKIAWTRLPSHPGSAHYRIAAGGSEKDEKIYFSGGTDNPYNYNGIGYDGRPAEPSPETFAFDLHDSKWKMINAGTPGPTSDHRGLLVTSDNLVILGGMEKGQIVTARVQVLSKKPVR
ncbi:MAG TPA: kelch repeat-containing protein [Terriglobales bacterium]|nr:kelch repeat-containing protein [Terriglobales bacterium]